MDINYTIGNCPHCNSQNCVALGNEHQIFGLVSITENNTIEYNKFLPVMPIVCKDCGHLEFIHINAKAIKDNN